MKRTTHVSILFIAISLAGCSNSSDGGDKSNLPPDADQDLISDIQEGKQLSMDSDLDGTPDWKDTDSDNDGFSDEFEAGDLDYASSPLDSDADGLPDYIDLDSDGNMIPDRVEGTADADGDGHADYRDVDDDNDKLRDAEELAIGAAPPVDTDGDGLPNYRDPDSDNDNNLDGDEGTVDTDRDGTANWLDLDSDNDGIEDREEAGDIDLRTPPADTDDDTIADFLDPDSDNDGISDVLEQENGTSRIATDSDGDDVSDLIEIGAGTDPLDDEDSPRSRGDFVFVVPYQEPSNPTRDTLNFQTALQAVDIYFGFDTSGSMSQELTAMANMSTGLPAIIDQLTCPETSVACDTLSDCEAGQVCNVNGWCAEDPRVNNCLPNIYTGVGSWDDVDSFHNITSPQSDPNTTARTIPNTGSGSEEAVAQAAACVADGANCNNSDRNCSSTGIGCPGFRNEAVRIYVQITDANEQCDGARCSMFTNTFAGSELARQSIKFIGLYGTDDTYGGTGTPESVATEIAIASGSVDGEGNPYVYPAVDGAVIDRTVEAIRTLANADNFRIDIIADDQEDDDGDALQFIDHMEVNTTAAACTRVANVVDTNDDGYLDTFAALRPGTPVCWDVVPAANMAVMPAAEPLVFKAKLTVRADGGTVDSRMVYFLIPPSIPDPGMPF